MSALKGLRQAEEWVFDLALWIFLIPFTFIRVLFRPTATAFVAVYRAWSDEAGANYNWLQSPVGGATRLSPVLVDWYWWDVLLEELRRRLRCPQCGRLA